jgi:general transcription factor IIIA
LLPSQLRKHARKHKVYTCSHAGCGSIFSKWSELRKHSKMHSKEYKCPSCDRVFNSKGNLRQHQITHDSDRQTFCCSYEGCARVFSRQSNLNVHIQSYHEAIKPFSCHHVGCNRSFPYKKSLDSHIQKVHLGGGSKPDAQVGNIMDVVVSVIFCCPPLSSLFELSPFWEYPRIVGIRLGGAQRCCL